MIERGGEYVAPLDSISRTLLQHRIYESTVTNWWRCAGCRQDVGLRREAERHQAQAILDALGLEQVGHRCDRYDHHNDPLRPDPIRGCCFPVYRASLSARGTTDGS